MYVTVLTVDMAAESSLIDLIFIPYAYIEGIELSSDILRKSATIHRME